MEHRIVAKRPTTDSGLLFNTLSSAIGSLSSVAFTEWVSDSLSTVNRQPELNTVLGGQEWRCAAHRHFAIIDPGEPLPACEDCSATTNRALSTGHALRFKMVMSMWLELSRPQFPSGTFRDLISPFTTPANIMDYNLNDQQFVKAGWYSLVMVVLPETYTNVATGETAVPLPLIENPENYRMTRRCAEMLSTMVGLMYVPSVHSLLTFFHPVSGKPMPRLLCRGRFVYDVYGIRLPSLSYNADTQMLTHVVKTSETAANGPSGVNRRRVAHGSRSQRGGLHGRRVKMLDGFASSVIEGDDDEYDVVSENSGTAQTLRTGLIVRHYPVPQIACNLIQPDCHISWSHIFQLISDTVSCSWMYGNSLARFKLSARAYSVAQEVCRVMGISMMANQSHTVAGGIPNECHGKPLIVCPREVRGITKPGNESGHPVIYTNVATV